MASTPNEVPKACKEDVIQDYSYSAGFEITKIFITVIAMLALALFLGLRSGTRPEPNAGWSIILFLGIVFAVGISWWIWRSHVRRLETGSRIDLGKRQIIWWDGRVPARRNTVEIDSLKRVELATTDSESATYYINLVGISGEPVRLPTKCVRDAKDWIRAFRSEFPSIELKILGEDSENDSREGFSFQVSDLPFDPASTPFIHLPNNMRPRDERKK